MYFIYNRVFIVIVYSVRLCLYGFVCVLYNDVQILVQVTNCSVLFCSVKILYLMLFVHIVAFDLFSYLTIGCLFS